MLDLMGISTFEMHPHSAEYNSIIHSCLSGWYSTLKFPEHVHNLVLYTQQCN